MAPSLACMVGAAACRMREHGLLVGADIGCRDTPFGPSDPICLVADADVPYYVVGLCDEQGHNLWAGSVNYRANLYALKDLGVQGVVGVAAAGAITHNYSVGDIVLVGDLLDMTARRGQTFFPHSGAGIVRQFPVFCPSLREAMIECLTSAGDAFHTDSTLVVTEGPRLETPAEVRLYASAGGELVSHRFAPEAFLAKELELCYAAITYVANYAETGSRYRPFSASDLFGGLTTSTEADRVSAAVVSIGRLVERLSKYVATHPGACECRQTMRHAVSKFGLDADWRQWFSGPSRRNLGVYQRVPPRQAPRPEASPAPEDAQPRAI